MKNRKWILCIVALIGFFLLSEMPAKADTEYPYLIKVNRKQCVVTVYEKDEQGEYTIPVKAMLCSPGWDTPLGTFKTPEKYRWRLLMGDVWGQYSTRINKGVLFHSVWYYEKDPATLSNVQFNKLGSVCSHGCVRLNVEDAKWIFDNCPVGTTVTIYDSTNPGPLGKPEAIRVSTKTKMGYDPTDAWSTGNPYLENQPIINGVKDFTVSYGKKVEILKGVTALSSTNVSINQGIETSITYKGKRVSKINTKKAGTYYVTYRVTDGLGKYTERSSIVTVVDQVAPKIKGAYNLYIGAEESFNEALLLDGVYAVWHGKKLSKDAVTVRFEEIKSSDDLSIYRVVYEATAPNGETVQKTKKVYWDVEAPVISGVEDKEIAVDTVVDKAFALENITVSDNYSSVSPGSIEVHIKKDSDTTYQVIYYLSDRCKNETKETATYTITNFLTFTGVSNQTISKYTYLGTYQALLGVKAYNKEQDITNQIKVSISELVDGAYTVTYSIDDSKGHKKTATAVFTVEAE